MKKEIREKLAEAEHDQWLEWSEKVEEKLIEIRSYILHDDNEKAYAAIQDRLFKWAKYKRPYNQLNEEEKDMDRIYVDKILNIINED